jgi:hypothetical protein
MHTSCHPRAVHGTRRLPLAWDDQMMPAAGDLGFVQMTEPEYGVFAEERREELPMAGRRV